MGGEEHDQFYTPKAPHRQHPSEHVEGCGVWEQRGQQKRENNPGKKKVFSNYR